jgi:LacI family transcriptional regulator
VRFLTEHRFPFVTMGRVLEPHEPHLWFDMDAEAGFAAATQLLLDLGHRDFAIFGPAEPFSYAALRRHGIEKVLNRAGIHVRPEHIVKAPVPDPTAISIAAEAMLMGPHRPTAVLGILDKYALAVQVAAREVGLSVPRDLSVIGFGDIPESSVATPPLSTFSQHSRDNGEMMADMIVNLIEEGMDAVKPELVPVDFMPRGSHGPVPRRILTCAPTVHALA